MSLREGARATTWQSQKRDGSKVARAPSRNDAYILVNIVQPMNRYKNFNEEHL